MSKINVLHIIGSLQIGGAEKALLLLLQNIDRTRFNPVVVTMYSDGVNDFFHPDFRALNVPLYHLRLKSWRDFTTFRQLRTIIRRHKIDIAHSHYGTLEFFGTLYARLAGVRHCVYTKHNLRLKSGVFYHLERILLNRYLTERIFSISQTVSRHLISVEHAKSNRIRLVYNPVETPRRCDDLQVKDLKKRWDISENRFIIGNTSRFDPSKGFNLFYLTLKNLLDMAIPVHAIVLSNQSGWQEHERLVNQYQLQAAVTILPFQKDLSQVYSLLDCYLYTSLHTEGFGMAVVEAMSYGLPVVGLNCGVISEIIRHRFDGLLPFPENWEKTYSGDLLTAAQSLAQAIADLHRNSQFYRKIAQNAQSTAANYSIANFVQRIETGYLELCR